MARASSSKPRAGSRSGIRRRSAMPQIVEAAPGTVGLGGGGSVGGASVGGALGAAEVQDGSYRAYATSTPQAADAEGAGALADGGASAEGAAALAEEASASVEGGSHTTTGTGSAAAGLEDAGAAQGGIAAAGAAASTTRSGGRAAAWVPAGLRRWLERARALGLREAELVFELHVRQGLPLLEVARVLGLGAEQAQELWRQGRASRAARAPQSESDFATLREHISAALWQTVEATFPDVMQSAEEDAEEAEPPAPSSPPMLSVRLKALDQIAKLYDLSLETRASALAPLPYATPEDIAASVRERVLEMHGRE